MKIVRPTFRPRTQVFSLLSTISNFQAELTWFEPGSSVNQSTEHLHSERWPRFSGYNKTLLSCEYIASHLHGKKQFSIHLFFIFIRKIEIPQTTYTTLTYAKKKPSSCFMVLLVALIIYDFVYQWAKLGSFHERAALGHPLGGGHCWDMIRALPLLHKRLLQQTGSLFPIRVLRLIRSSVHPLVVTWWTNSLLADGRIIF